MPTAVLSRVAALGSAFTGESAGDATARRRRLLGWAAVGVLAAVVYLVFVRPGQQVDLRVFLKAGDDVRHGRDPYSSTDSETIRTNAAFVYPIVVAWAFVPLSVLGSAAPLVYAIASLAAIVLACWWMRPGEPWLAAVVLLTSSTVIGLQVGSVNPWLLLGVVAAWKWRDRPLRCGPVVAVLIVGKLFLWPVFGWLLLSRRYRAAAVTAVISGAALLGGFAFGPLGLRDYVDMLHVLSGIEARFAASLTGLFIHWQASLGTATAAATLAGLAVLAAAGWQLRRRGDGGRGRGSEEVVFAAAIAATLLASPIVWHHYYLLLAAPLLLAAHSVWPFLIVGVAGWSAAAPHATTSGHTAAGYVLGLGGLAAIAACAALRGRVTVSGLAPVLVVVVVIAGAVVVASVAAGVSVLGGWGALVTLLETAGVLAYVWTRKSGFLPTGLKSTLASPK